MKRLLINVARSLGVAIALLFGLTQLLRRTSMFFPSRYPEGRWDQTFSQPHSEVQFTTDDGVRLHGWWFQQSASAPSLIWCHGNGGNITDRAATAARLAGYGVNVLIFDWRGYGRSEGTPSEAGLFRDGLAAWDFVHQQAPQSPICLYGESLGGPFAASVARLRKTKCVVIENSFPSLADVGNTLYAPLPLGWFAPFALRTADWLNQAGVPVLVLHGRQDRVIPFTLGQRLYDQLRVPKAFLISEHAGHCEIPTAEGQRYYDAVAGWVLRTPTDAANIPQPQRSQTRVSS